MAEIKPMAIVAIVGGTVFLYSGIRGKSLSSAFRNILMGKSPAMATSANQISIAGNILSPVSGTSGTSPVVVKGQGGNFQANAISILRTLGAPVTSANIASLIHWQTLEGANTYNNPLNTTLKTNASVGVWNSVGVQEYGTIGGGIAANVETLLGGYPGIVAALRSGQGLSGGGGEVSAELSKWSGGGYSSV